MRFYGAEYNIVVLCSIKPHIDLVQGDYSINKIKELVIKS
jgi:hypothetical protein